MSKRVVIALGYGTAADRNAITSHLQAKGGGIGWWHHIPDLWLVDDPSRAFNVHAEAEAIRKIISAGSHLLVFDVDNTEFRQGALLPQAWQWLSNSWKKQDTYSGLAGLLGVKEGWPPADKGSEPPR